VSKTWQLPGEATNLAAQKSNFAAVIVHPGNWTSKHTPSTATQATTTKAAGGAGVRHICNSITATIACDSTAQTPLLIRLRDGAASTGTILWEAAVSAIANGLGGVCVTGLNIVGSANTAMTLEFSAAGVTGTQQSVTLGGYSAS
jgi:hypothetical protein